MKLFNPKKVIDTDSFLPSDGENSFDMSYSDRNLTVSIFFDSNSPDQSEEKKSLLFVQAKYFFKTPFPGFSFFECPEDRDISLLDALVEYEYSDLLTNESELSGSGVYRHYRIFLHSSGVAIHVIAQSVELLP